VFYVQLAEEKLGERDPLLADAVHERAVAQLFLSDLDRAEQLFLRALTLREKALGVDRAQSVEEFLGLARVAPCGLTTIALWRCARERFGSWNA
jgi:hypothetical protein